MIILNQMIVLFLIMVIGYVLCKKDILDDHAQKKISSIVVNVANPMLILSGAFAEGEKVTGRDLALMMLFAILLYIALLILSAFVPRLLKIDIKDRGVYSVMLVFSNIGFMGFPIISAAYGKHALLYASLFLVPYNFLIYTYGIAALKADKGSSSNAEPSSKPGSEKKPDDLLHEETSSAGKWVELLKKVCNIGVLACILTCIIYTCNVPVPGFLRSVIDMLSNLTAPLSMFVIGASFTKFGISEFVKDYKLILFSIIKLMLIPILGIMLCKQFIHNPEILGVCLVILATPVGSMTVMLSQEYDGDYELAAKGVAFTTLLSVVTLPVVSMIVF